jgi:hypothetical protein
VGGFLLLWLLAIAIVFSLEIIIGLYWYEFIFDGDFFRTNPVQSAFFHKKYLNYLNIYSWWFIFLFSFITGIFAGWVVEKNLKLLSRVNLFWQNKQPEFYRNTRGERRVFLAWLIIEFPVLLIVIINIILLFIFHSYTRLTFGILFFTGGFITGQLIEVIKEYTVILEQDRPEMPPTSIIQKISPDFPSRYSLFLGQLYCRAILPLFFLYMAIFIPGWFIIIPNYSNISLLIIFFSIILGIGFRWAYDRKNRFYFGNITLNNFSFLTLKLILLISLIAFTLITFPSLYLLTVVCIASGFVIPWHPEKLRR